MIRAYQTSDWPSVCAILRAVVKAGDSFAYSPASTDPELRGFWIDSALATYVACGQDGSVLGTYKLLANQPGLGSHVANCGYAVSPHARGRGLAALMCAHSQAEAVRLGFRAMQFNLVVATNLPAVRLWQKLGFRILATLPGVFKHARLGYVDAHVMFKTLVD